VLNANDIIAEAEERVGIQDPELVLRPNLERFLSALSSDNKLSSLGETTARKVLIDRTADRLEGIKWVRNHPEIANDLLSVSV
jgi:hypothetical protein